MEEEGGGPSPVAAPTEVEIDSDRSTRNAKNTERNEKREGGVEAEANEHRVPQSNWILEGRAELKRPINLQCKKSSH